MYRPLVRLTRAALEMFLYSWVMRALSSRGEEVHLSVELVNRPGRVRMNRAMPSHGDATVLLLFPRWSCVTAHQEREGMHLCPTDLDWLLFLRAQ